MTSITETLTVEHTLLNYLFDEILCFLPDVRTVKELRLLTRLCMTGVNPRHAPCSERRRAVAVATGASRGRRR
jgi:hypothetical protein